MPDPAAFGPALAIGLLLLVMLWFTFGTQRNVRLGNDILHWLQGGLPLLGKRTTMRWLGSSAVELAIADAAPPFRDATVVVVLEARDVGLLWAYGRARGRRDFIIVRANLRRAPGFIAEVGDPKGWTGRLDRPPAAEGMRPLRWPDGITGYAAAGADEQLIREAWRSFERASGGVWKVAVQPVVPHLEVHVRPPDRDRVQADRLLGAVRDVAVRLTHR
jgi:hypothetical protein